MSYSNLRTPGALVLGLAALLGCGEGHKVALQSAAASVYSRSDTNATTIWAPRARAGIKVGDSASFDTVYALDAWTSASVDIVTAASKQVHEVRQEVTTGGSYELSDVTLGASYRYSTENDYWSHGGVLSFALDMADNNTTLALAAFGASDTVGRSGWSDFRRPQSSLGGRLSLTQVLDTKSVAQLSWETTRISGFQSSPYRFVAIGGQGTCASSSLLCVPESHPSERLRHAASLSGRRALGSHLSMGLDYRFYLDDWGIMSHTIAPDFALSFGERGKLDLTYRYYTQRSADFYRARYLGDPGELHYVTRDRKLSALYDNQLGLTYEQGFLVGVEDSTVFKLALRTSVTRIVYQAYVGLRRVDVLEATLALSLDWR